MNIDAIIVVIVIFLMLISLYRELLQPALIFLISTIIFYFAGIIDTKEILQGLANENVILIFLLFVISDIVKKTTVMDSVINHLFQVNQSLRSFLLRQFGIVSFFSAWINNTPLVAFMMPYSYDWAKKKGLTPSKVMLPLSYAAIMGGTITLIGTSTNLVVNGLAVEAGLKSLNIFDFAWVGIPAVIFGCIYIYFFGPKLLPARKDIMGNFREQSREYLVETLVPAKSKLINQSVEKAHLRNLKGLYLAQIVRNGQTIVPVSPKEIIYENDRLFFAGDTKTILELMEGNKNLELPYGQIMMVQTENNIHEVIITNNSRLHNKTAKSSNFRKKYDAAIIAIQRNGEKLSGKIGEIELKAGDLLLLVTGKDFYNLLENEQDFFITNKIKDIATIPRWKKILFFSSLISVFVLAVMKILSLLTGMLIVLGVTSMIRMVKFQDMKKAIDLNLLIILVLALALGKAISNSGVATLASDFMLSLVKGNPIGILICLYIITNITSMFVTNAAAVAITFPIAFAAIVDLHGVPTAPFILAIAYAGSAEFITPFGYQTNLMVYGPGGYQFRDYIRLGLPLTIMYMIFTVVILGLVYNLF